MLIAPLALRSRIVSSAFYEVTEAEAQGGIKKGCGVEDGRGEVWVGRLARRRSASLHLPTNFMRLVNSSKKLTDRLIHGLSNFII